MNPSYEETAPYIKYLYLGGMIMIRCAGDALCIEPGLVTCLFVFFSFTEISLECFWTVIILQAIKFKFCPLC